MKKINKKAKPSSSCFLHSNPPPKPASSDPGYPTHQAVPSHYSKVIQRACFGVGLALKIANPEWRVDMRQEDFVNQPHNLILRQETLSGLRQRIDSASRNQKMAE
jgi:hypothetical protein